MPEFNPIGNVNILGQLDNVMGDKVGTGTFDIMGNPKDIFSGNGESSVFIINLMKPLSEIKAFDLNRPGNKLPSPCVAPTISAGLGIGGRS